MKINAKHYVFITLTLLFIINQGLAQTVKSKNSLEYLGLNRKVKTMKVNKYEITLHPNGLPVFGNPENEEYRFNEQGYQIVKYNWNSESKSVTIFIYDDEWKLLEKYRSFPNGMMEWRITYKYDKKSNQVEFNFDYHKGDALDSKSIMTYDDEGNFIERKMFFSDGISLFGIQKSAYDTAGNLIERLDYNPDGNLEFRRKYSYDNKSNMFQELIFNSSENQETQISYQYELDENSNWIKCWKYKNEIWINLIERQFEYY